MRVKNIHRIILHRTQKSANFICRFSTVCIGSFFSTYRVFHSLKFSPYNIHIVKTSGPLLIPSFFIHTPHRIMSGSLPPGWITKTSSRHPDRQYYFNTATGQSQVCTCCTQMEHHLQYSRAGTSPPSLRLHLLGHATVGTTQRC